METVSALLGICVGNSPVPGEFPAQRPVARSFDVFFDLRLNKRLSKQSWGWWFETLSSPLWRHCNELSETQKACFLHTVANKNASPLRKLTRLSMRRSPCLNVFNRCKLSMLFIYYQENIYYFSAKWYGGSGTGLLATDPDQRHTQCLSTVTKMADKLQMLYKSGWRWVCDTDYTP